MTEQAQTRRATVACQFCSKLNRVDIARVADRPKCGECGRPMLLDRPIRLTEHDFDRVVSGTDVPVLVDFYADWCGPCKIMAPVLDDIAQRHAGRMIVGKLDTDRNQSVAARFAIRGIPTLILFRDGREHARQVGAASLGQLEAMIAK
jgi:thioredoxin 2